MVAGNGEKLVELNAKIVLCKKGSVKGFVRAAEKQECGGIDVRNGWEPEKGFRELGYQKRSRQEGCARGTTSMKFGECGECLRNGERAFVNKHKNGHEC
jgi:hypothetical protein